jgi:hypothetical protein
LAANAGHYFGPLGLGKDISHDCNHRPFLIGSARETDGLRRLP